MKKFILSSVLVSGMVLGGVQFVSADETAPEFDPIMKKDETTLGISFDTDDATKPVEGPYKGVLSLIYVPKAFEFGKHAATGALLDYQGLGFGENDQKQWVVVNDDRENTELATGVKDPNSKKGDPWKLTATMAELKSGDEVLPSTLVMSFDDVKKYDMGQESDGKGDIKPNPATDDFIKAFGESDKHGVELNKAVTLESGKAIEEQVFAKKEADKLKVGVASQVTGTQLTVQAPKTAAGKTFSSKVTWTLSTGL